MHKLDENDIRSKVRKKIKQAASAQVEKVSGNSVDVSVFNNKQTLIARITIPAPNGVNEDEIYIGKEIIW